MSKKPHEILIRCAFGKMVPPADLKPNPRNPNTHPKDQIERLAKIISHQGWRRAIVVSNRSGFVVTGHGSLQAGMLMKCAEVPVDYQDFASDADEWAHLLADNRIAELSEINHDALDLILGDLNLAEFDISLTGFDEQVDEAIGVSIDDAKKTLAERFGVPPFTILDARQGYWQDRKRAWIAIGIKSEVGRGGQANTSARSENPTYREIKGGGG